MVHARVSISYTYGDTMHARYVYINMTDHAFSLLSENNQTDIKSIYLYNTIARLYMHDLLQIAIHNIQLLDNNYDVTRSDGLA